ANDAHNVDYEWCRDLPAKTFSTPPHSPTIQPKLRDLLIALYCQLPTPGTKDTAFDSILVRFLILSGLKPNADWKHSGDITQTIAALTFCGRLTMYDIMTKSTHENSTIHQQFPEVAMYFEEINEAVLPQMYLYLRGLSSLKTADQHFYQFNAPSFQGDAVIIDGETLRLSQIHDFVENLCEQIGETQDRLLDGKMQLPPDVLIHDDPRNTTGGYGFPDHIENKKLAPEGDLLQHILNTPHLRDKYSYRKPDGTFVWLPGPCHELLKEIHHNMMQICLAILLTFGAPGRGTELLTHLIRNVAGGSIRNVFCLFRTLLLRGSYNKTADATSVDKTMGRSPTVVIANLTIRNILFLRPAYVELLAVFRPHMAHEAYHFLFPGLTRSLTTRDLSGLLVGAFKSMGITRGISIGQYRSMVSFIIQCNSLLFQREEQHTAADQMGHSSSMNREHYGGDERFPLGLNDHTFQATVTMSAKYHALLGFPPTLLVSLMAGRQRQIEILNTFRSIQNGEYSEDGQQGVQPRVAGVLTNVVQAPILPVVSRAMLDQLLPAFVQQVSAITARGVAAFANIAYPNISPAQDYGAPSITRSPELRLLMTLRELLVRTGDTRVNRGFSDAAQGEVSQLMLEGESHLAYISPTGNGKGSPAIINQMMFKGVKTTMYLVLMNAIRGQLLFRCIQAGLTASVWSPHMRAQDVPDNLIVPVESTESAELLPFLGVLVTQGRLSRIIVDEAHLILAHHHFRGVMNTLTWVGKVGVPVVVQSATLPPSILPHLFAKLGISQYRTCREATPRPNISYNFVTDPFPRQELKRIYERHMAGEGKMLIFCNDKSTAKEIATGFGIDFADGTHSSEEIEVILSKLRDGTRRAIASTTVLGVALDVADVNLVVHLGCPYNALGFSQETGRGGRRAGTMATSIVLLEPNLSCRRFPSPDYSGGRLMYDLAMNRNLCRRFLLTLYVDGVGTTCSMMEHSQGSLLERPDPPVPRRSTFATWDPVALIWCPELSEVHAPAHLRRGLPHSLSATSNRSASPIAGAASHSRIYGLAGTVLHRVQALTHRPRS
ncbi:hypothetical protein HWV62_39780, partial [Athelia sp. TMB]